jgi:cysteine desulfurase
LRDELLRRIRESVSDVSLNGSATRRLPGNLNVSFAKVEAEALMLSLKNVALSSGSACSSASREPSYVLRAIGVADELAKASLRFGLGRFNTREEVERVAALLTTEVPKLRAASTRYAE